MENGRYIYTFPHFSLKLTDLQAGHAVANNSLVLLYHEITRSPQPFARCTDSADSNIYLQGYTRPAIHAAAYYPVTTINTPFTVIG